MTILIIGADDGAALSDRAERTVRALFEHPLLDATWSRYEPGEKGPDPHIHREHVDAFYVVEGELEFGVGPDVQPVHAPAGTFVLVPPYVVHTFANRSRASARWLNFHAPSTGFIASMRGDQDGFDSYDAPDGGGLAAGEVTVASAHPAERRDGAEAGMVSLGRERRLRVLELALAPDSDAGIAAHAGVISSFFVIAGEVELIVGDERIRAGRRTWASLPPGVACRVANNGEEPARVLQVCAPAPWNAEIRSGHVDSMILGALRARHSTDTDS
jgi:mannose-6-phosphate isomerase-like protein (cupin superfamily)